ncbi:MAG TPA: hypothetical protein VIO35_04810, partial [Chloroflexota bacterium]
MSSARPFTAAMPTETLSGGTIPIPPSKTSTATIPRGATETPTITPTNFGGFTSTPTQSPTPTSTIAPISTGYVVTPGAVATFATNNGQVQISIPSNFWPTPVGGGSENVTLNVFPAPIPGARTTVNGSTPLLVLELDLSVNGTPTSGTAFA